MQTSDTINKLLAQAELGLDLLTQAHERADLCGVSRPSLPGEYLFWFEDEVVWQRHFAAREERLGYAGERDVCLAHAAHIERYCAELRALEVLPMPPTPAPKLPIDNQPKS